MDYPDGESFKSGYVLSQCTSSQLQRIF